MVVTTEQKMVEQMVDDLVERMVECWAELTVGMMGIEKVDQMVDQ